MTLRKGKLGRKCRKCGKVFIAPSQLTKLCKKCNPIGEFWKG